MEVNYGPVKKPTDTLLTDLLKFPRDTTIRLGIYSVKSLKMKTGKRNPRTKGLSLEHLSGHDLLSLLKWVWDILLEYHLLR